MMTRYQKFLAEGKFPISFYNYCTLSQLGAGAVKDWVDTDQDVFKQVGAENDFYSGEHRGYPCKNAPFDSVAEVLLVRGVTPAIFAKMREYVTVFPQQGKRRRPKRRV